MVSGHLVDLCYLDLLLERLVTDGYLYRLCGLVLIGYGYRVLFCGEHIVLFPYCFFDDVGSAVQVFGCGDAPSICCNGVNDGSMLKTFILISGTVNDLVSRNGEGKVCTGCVLAVGIGLCNLDRSHDRGIFHRDKSVIETFDFCSPSIVCLFLNDFKGNIFSVLVIVGSCAGLLDVVSAWVQGYV